MILVDSHCHLDEKNLRGKALTEVLASAAQHHVHYLHAIGTTREDFKEIHPLAMAHANIFCSFGIHPHHAGEGGLLTEAEILAEAQKEKVIGIGETGLDYFYDNAPREAQQESFRRHIRAARMAGVPVIIHTRDAEDDTIAIVKEALEEGPVPFLFHCFSSSPKLANFAIDNGLYVSASGIITFNKAEEVREGINKVPLEYLLVETDSPYLAPIPFRGKTNEPAYTLYVAEKLAEMKGVPLKDVAQQTTENFFTLFKKAAAYRAD